MPPPPHKRTGLHPCLLEPGESGLLGEPQRKPPRPVISISLFPHPPPRPRPELCPYLSDPEVRIPVGIQPGEQSKTAAAHSQTCAEPRRHWALGLISGTHSPGCVLSAVPPMQPSQLGDPCCFTDGAAEAQRGHTACKCSWQDVNPECLAPESILLNTILCQIQTYSVRLTHRELSNLVGVFLNFTTLSKWGPSNPTAGHKP